MTHAATALGPSVHEPAPTVRRARNTRLRVAPPRPAVADAEAALPLEAVLPHRPDGGSHAAGLAVVVAVHLVVGYALLSGLAMKVVERVRAPIEARLIEATKPTPPPPPPPPTPVEVAKPIVKAVAPPPPFVPPPEVVVAPPPAPAAPTIAVVNPEPPPAPVEFKPEPPPPPPPVEAKVDPLPPPAAAPVAPQTVAIGVACPTMVSPVIPRRAQQEGIGGTVKARAIIRDGKVVDVQILSSTPRGVFDAAVRTAMSRYGCQTSGANEIIATQTFEFRSAE